MVGFIKKLISTAKKNKENLAVMALGLAIIVTLNVMMLGYHYDAWTNPKVGFWTAFWNKFEVSGFDPYTYIVISKWRPLYVLSRHPLLAGMMWPLSELNVWLKDITGMNCAIFIVAVMMTALSLCSWWLMYRIMRRIVRLEAPQSLLLTLFFFSFSHVMLVLFVEDHMALTLPLLLLAVYWAGKATAEGKRMPLWKALPLLFVATGVTTTNCVKVGMADLVTRWGREPFARTVRHFMFYLLPLAVVGGLFFYQDSTTQREEQRNIENTVTQRMKRDSVFAEQWTKEQKFMEMRKKQQLIHLSFVTNTDYKIDRLPSLVENVFGEGFILHERFALKDANKNHRPVLVRYTDSLMYVLEGMIVLLFALGVWAGRRERVVWAVMMMFLMDMALHVGLNFASADVYIMTAHWAFAIPVSVGYLMKKTASKRGISMALTAAILFLTVFMWVHNMQIISSHILNR